MRLGNFLVMAGLALVAWGVISWFLMGNEGDTFYTDVTYNIFYLVMGAIVLWSGTTWNPEVRRPWVKIFGSIFGVLAIVGWIVSSVDAPNLLITNMETADNVAHTVIALVFLLVGFYGKKDDVYLEPPGTTMNI